MIAVVGAIVFGLCALAALALLILGLAISERDEDDNITEADFEP